MDEAYATGGNTSLRLEGPWSTGSLSNLANNGEDLEILPIDKVTINGKPPSTLERWMGFSSEL
jgi:arabinogalactan oligomer/maltooligosaccharide transport system substrate-binding protein